MSTLEWFKAFFHMSGGFVQRDFSLAAFNGQQSSLEIIVDASPWGLAGVLIVDGVVAEYFADPIGPYDCELYGHQLGSPNGQQVWESLTALVALRLWEPLWANKAVRLRLKGDSVTMLTLVVNMRPSSPALSIIGRELAMVFSKATYVPIVAQHVPGVANVIADKLFRWFQPGVRPETPSALANARHRSAPSRVKDYYLTLNSSGYLPNNAEE